MTWTVAIALVAATALGIAAGAGLGRLRERARLKRVAEGMVELARGNLAHRVILPGDDEAARMAESLNTLADAIQSERESSASCDETRRLLLANISHDLRTPITSIAGYVDALQRGLGDQPERYLSVIGEKTDELAQLTDDLFYAARLDAGDLALEQRPLDLAEAVRRCVLGFEPQLASKGACVAVAIPEGPRYVVGDPSAVRRILSNLVANSVRHGDGMTTFSVELREDAGAFVVRVANDGPRLPDAAERLFDRGVTGSSSGAGLGLSIARGLSERMGASVSAENGATSGVAFMLAFPKWLEFNET